MQRGRWTTDATLAPDLLHLGRARFLRAETGGLVAHVHPGAWEIVLVRAGTVEWWAGEERWTVGPNRYFLTRPDEPHGGDGSVMHPCDLRWMTVRDARAAPWLTGVPRSGPASATLGAAFEALIEEHLSPGERSGEAADAWLTVALSALRRPVAAESDPSLSPVLGAVRRALDEPWPVSRMADAAGYSTPRFHARFRAAFGESPARWLRRERVAAARRWLASGASVGETAQATGFATPQHLASLFRAETGESPSAFAARSRGGVSVPS